MNATQVMEILKTVLTMFYQNKIKKKDVYLYSIKTKFNNWDKSFFNSLEGEKVVFYFQYSEEHLQAIASRSK